MNYVYPPELFLIDKINISLVFITSPFVFWVVFLLRWNYFVHTDSSTKFFFHSFQTEKIRLIRLRSSDMWCRAATYRRNFPPPSSPQTTFRGNFLPPPSGYIKFSTHLTKNVATFPGRFKTFRLGIKDRVTLTISRSHQRILCLCFRYQLWTLTGPTHYFMSQL